MKTQRTGLARVAVERKGKIYFARPYRFIYPLAQAFTRSGFSVEGQGQGRN